jgi:hypothetical protein
MTLVPLAATGGRGGRLDGEANRSVRVAGMTRGGPARLAIVAVLVAGCGSSGGSPASLAALGAKLGCANPPVVEPTQELFVREYATCSFEMPDQSRQAASFHTFATPEAQANWRKLADQFASGVRVDGTPWVVSLDNQVAGAAAQKRLGGKLV